MSCNGCRVLRKGCSETCVLRHSLRCIDSPEAQAHATLFVTKFFGRAGLTGFINGVPENQRPALFQSLLYEACGRTVNPVYGAVGLLFAGKWAVCQAAVDSVLKGGSPKPSGMYTDLQSITASEPCNFVPAIDCSAGSISTVEQPHPSISGIIIKPNINPGFCMQPQPFPTTDQSSVDTSACSLKTKSTNCHGGDTTTSSVLPHILSKRIRQWKPEYLKEEDSIFKRPRSSLMSFCAAPVDNSHDGSQMTEPTQRPSITSCIAAYKNSYSRDCSQDRCVSQLNIVEHLKQPDKVGVRGPAAEYVPLHSRVVAPVARRVHYIPPHLKQLIEDNYKDGRNMSVPSRLSREEGDYQPDIDMLSKGDPEPLPQQTTISSDRVNGDESDQLYGMRKLDLTLKAQPSVTLGYHVHNIEPSLQHERAFINLDHRQYIGEGEEPHEILRVSSPSVNSEGSVSTSRPHVGGGSLKMMRSSSCFSTAMETPKDDGVKLLNLLL
ncbi:hypothetical protein GOP47_0015797 [Adiantum capillus-veneris]|uniref:LOB domain-containing protein n=1 Tax=Adiantum capillus-veneris TaxID=13818 RepID=A0A9D4UL97_ADICA|nr:hypothetical protein GOP47_0015797 [Adiantum capillus-veneris]